MKNKIETLKSAINNDRLVLQQMRSSASMHNEVAMLRDQCRKELEMLDESIVDQSFSMQKHNIEADTRLPQDDDDGEKLMEFAQRIEEAISAKHTEAQSKASRSEDDFSKNQKILAEKSALLASSQRNLHSTKTKMDELAEKVQEVRKLVDEIRAYEIAGKRRLTADERNPAALLKYLDDRLIEIEKNAPLQDEDKTVNKVLKRLYKKVSCESLSSIIEITLMAGTGFCPQ